MKKLLYIGLIGVTGTALFLALRKSPRQKLIEQTADLMTEEGQRIGKPVNRDHAILALKRFEDGNLKLFNQWVKVWIARDETAMWGLFPQMKASILPVIRESRDWARYENIVLPG